MPNASNIFLHKLPRIVLNDLLPQLDPVTLEEGQQLHRAGEPLRDIYFPTTSLVSIQVMMDAARSLEVALVGREGAVGLHTAAVGMQPFSATVQTTGAALRIRRARLLAIARRHVELEFATRELMLLLTAKIAVSAGCTRFHLLEARLARRLVMTGHRLGSRHFRITQEILAAFLAVRRVSISEAASSLQRRNLISYHRGEITILDQERLEAACCACPRD